MIARQHRKQINEAEGKAREIQMLAEATAEGIERIVNNTMILPAELSNIGAAVAGLAEVLNTARPAGKADGVTHVRPVG